MTLSTSSSQRAHWLTRALVPLALLATGAQSACISLQGSTACPSFSQFSVDTNVAKNINDLGLGMNMTAFTDVTSFDASIFGSTAFMSSPSTCTGYTSAQMLRYQTTVLCTMVAQDADSAKCSPNAPDMCISSCTLFANSLQTMISTVCPKDQTSLKDLTTLNATCTGSGQDWTGLQSSANNCVNATTNEAATCGFGTQISMCTFCSANPTDACCVSGAGATCTATTTALPTSTITPISPPASGSHDDGGSQKSSLSTAALGGIIAGGVVALLALVAILVVCLRRSRANGRGSKVGGSKNLSRNMSTSSSTKYNISAPKIQEEGFSSSMNPSIPMTALPTIMPAVLPSDAGAIAAANRISRANSTAGAGNNGKPSYCQVLYPYEATMADELDLTQGDIINVHSVFDDGWAVGVNMNTSNEGAFPVVCVAFVDESALDDDFEDVNMHSMAPMGHREDDLGRNGSQRSSLPSRASSPVHLPKRHSSILRDSTIFPGNGNGGMTSSPLAGGNNSNQYQRGLQPPVRDTMMSDASSINRWWEGEGSSK